MRCLSMWSALVLVLVLALSVTGCGGDKNKTASTRSDTATKSDTGTTTSAEKPKTTGAAKGAKPPPPRFTITKIQNCLKKSGIKIEKQITGIDNLDGATVKNADKSILAIFKGTKYGAAVDNVGFLFYMNRAAAKQALPGIVKRLDKKKKQRVAIRDNLIAFFGLPRSQDETKVVVGCLGPPPPKKKPKGSDQKSSTTTTG